MKFLVPIVNSEKPMTITNKLLKAIFDSFSDNHLIGWDIILEDVISKEVSKVSNKKGCPLAPFLYYQYKWFTVEEATNLPLFLDKRRDMFPKDAIPAHRVPTAAKIVARVAMARISSSSTIVGSSAPTPNQNI